jgi:hypothetical protein
MPSNLPNTENVAISGVCLFRVARLNADCSPVNGNGSGYVTAGIADFTASPQIEEGTEIIHKNGCGQIMYRQKRPNRIKSFTVSGNLSFFDPEALFQIFGGQVVLGRAGGPFAGDTIGWAAPNYDNPNTNGVYLEVISQTVAEGSGDCVSVASDRPGYIGHIFGKAILVPGDLSLTEGDAILVPFTGDATANPNLFDGPWDDFPGEGYIPTSPYVPVGYSLAQYEAILADVAAGAADLPAASA